MSTDCRRFCEEGQKFTTHARPSHRTKVLYKIVCRGETSRGHQQPDPPRARNSNNAHGKRALPENPTTRKRSSNNNNNVEQRVGVGRKDSAARRAGIGKATQLTARRRRYYPF